MTNELISAEMVNSARKGNQEAIATLYTQTYQDVYYVIRTMTKVNRETAQDLIQDTYLKAFQRLDQLREAEKFGAWIKKIAINSTVDYIRKNKDVLFSELSCDESYGEYDLEEDNPSHIPELVLDRQETARILHDILDSLPTGQRAVISMHYFQGKTIKEIAVLMEKEEGTIKAQLNHGRKNLANKVRELEYKEHIKLYGLSPIPFLLLLLRNAESMPMEPDEIVLERISHSEELIKICTATDVSSNIAGKPMSAAVKGTAAKGMMSKIAAGTLAATLVCGGAVIGFRETLAVPPENASPVVSQQTTIEADYETLIEDYLSIMKGDIPIQQSNIDLSRSALWVTPAGSVIDQNGYFVIRDSVRYTVFEYDINGDQTNELITCEEYKMLDNEWEGEILDIFTFHEGKPVWLIAGQYRGWIDLCEDGVIRMVGNGGVASNGYNYYKIQDGELRIIETGTEDWGNYSVNGFSCSNVEFQQLIERYVPLTDPEFELITVYEP